MCLLSESTTEAKDGRHSSQRVRSSQASHLIAAHSRASTGKLNESQRKKTMISFIFILLYTDEAQKYIAQTVIIKCFFTCCACVSCLVADRKAGQSSSRASALSDAPSKNTQVPLERLDSLDPQEPAVTEMFISQENISKMDNILDTWSNNLKVSLLPDTIKILSHSVNTSLKTMLHFSVVLFDSNTVNWKML